MAKYMETILQATGVMQGNPVVGGRPITQAQTHKMHQGMAGFDALKSLHV
jgi:hypothetical protein